MAAMDTMSAATPAFVHGYYSCPQTSQATVPVTFAAAQTAGNLNVVVVGWNDTTATLNTVTDKAGNTYQLAVGPSVLSGALSQAIYYAKNIAAAGANANTVTVTFSVAAVYPDVRILEYSGLDTSNPFDVGVGASGSSTNSNSGSVTTSATDLVVGGNTVLTTTTGAGSGFTKRLITSPDGDIAEDRVTAAGSYSATAPVSPSAGWVMQMAAFRAAGSPTPTPASTPTFIQGNSATPQTSQTTVPVSYNAAQTKGNLNVVIVGWNDTTAHISPIADTKGNVYQLAVGPTLLSGALSQSIYYDDGTAGAAEVDQLVSYGSSFGAVTTTNALDLLVAANTVLAVTTGPGPNFTSRMITSPNADGRPRRAIPRFI
jgi:hypothetical protein